MTCKICDSGTLSSKKIFRLSGPAVAIGFILLIPSILGMIFFALVFIVVNTGYGSNIQVSRSERPFQSASDAGFRRSCARSAKQNYVTAGVPAPMPLIEQYCECALSTFKETGSETMAAQTCKQQANDGLLDTPSQDIDALYSGDIPREGRDSETANLFRGIGSTFALFWGIAFFVSGLLGWLLVMKKRVLQCDICGAVVNAS